MHPFSALLASVVAGLMALVPPARAGAAASADPWIALEKKFESAYPADGPGAYVIAAQGDRILISRGFGLSNVEHRVPLTSDSVVRIASLTKQFTAVAVLLLVQDHRLSLDERLERVLPNCPSAWRAITLRELLNQTSGVTDDLSPMYKNIMNDLTVDQILALYLDRPLDSAPGATWRYSNLNYWILGKVIETTSGQPYADFVTRRVLAKGMTRTRYGSHDAIIANRAQGYESDPKSGWVNARYFSQALGYSAGGFLSTPGDMTTWYAALSRGGILSRATLELALTEAKTTGGKPTGYGLGWYLSHSRGKLIAHHGSSTFGFQSCIYWIPSRSLFVGVFKNSSDERGEPENDARALLGVAEAR